MLSSRGLAPVAQLSKSSICFVGNAIDLPGNVASGKGEGWCSKRAESSLGSSSLVPSAGAGLLKLSETVLNFEYSTELNFDYRYPSGRVVQTSYVAGTA